MRFFEIFTGFLALACLAAVICGAWWHVFWFVSCTVLWYILHKENLRPARRKDRVL